MVALSTRPRTRLPTILDEYGKPLSSFARRVPAPRNPGGSQTANTHPAHGLTAEMLISYYRSAEAGAPTRQFDCFHDIIEVDGDLRSKLNDRNESVSGCDFVVMPPAGRSDKPSMNAAQALNERLQDQIQFRAFLAHQLTAVPYGFACSNLVWDYLEGVVTPIEFANPAHRRFAAPSAARADEIWLIDGAFGNVGLIPLEPGLWACSRYYNILGRNPYAAGLMRTAAWWSMFKRWSVRDWQVFAEMFGLPLAIGYYEEGAGEAPRLKLEEAVRSIGSDGYAVLSALTDLVIKETARGGDSSTVYPQIVKLCEEQIAKLITGGTLNTDVAGVGSYNAASVHESRSYSMKCYDAKCVEEMFTQTIGTTFVAWNGYDRAAPPRLKIKIRRDALEWAQTVEIIGQAIELDQDQLREDFGLREPAPGRGVKFQAKSESGPGGPGGEKKKESK